MNNYGCKKCIKSNQNQVASMQKITKFNIKSSARIPFARRCKKMNSE